MLLLEGLCSCSLDTSKSKDKSKFGRSGDTTVSRVPVLCASVVVDLTHCCNCVDEALALGPGEDLDCVELDLVVVVVRVIVDVAVALCSLCLFGDGGFAYIREEMCL